MRDDTSGCAGNLGAIRRCDDEAKFVFAVPFNRSESQPHNHRQVRMDERKGRAGQPRDPASQDVELGPGLDFRGIGKKRVLEIRHGYPPQPASGRDASKSAWRVAFSFVSSAVTSSGFAVWSLVTKAA